MSFNVTCSYNRYSAYLTNRPTLEEAVGAAQWAREYYEPMYPGTLAISISVACVVCEGVGRLSKGRKNVRFPKYKDCAGCDAVGFLPLPCVA
jgi:hypothetical protein